MFLDRYVFTKAKLWRFPDVLSKNENLYLFVHFMLDSFSFLKMQFL